MESGTPQNGQSSLPRSNRIQKLSEAVSNKIAAGEVIQRPGNALKELLENSLDAGATNIQVQAKEGGLKFLQIQDNGTGIQLEDLPLVCERFTTSKLRKFDDLEAITTFGFRGEALASISHIARVSILTRTKDSKCAYRALYSSGALVPAKQGGPANPQPCAGNVGTTISVEDMFYNAPLRRKAFKLINEEYQRILDVMNRYAIHCSGVAFSCRKQGANFPDLQTTSHASTVEKISQIYGRKLALELLEFKASSQEFKFQCKGYITHSNYNLRRIVFLLFINNRLVSSPALKRAIDGVYAPLLLKGTHPFIYLSLELPSNLVDVNVHPTKREVHFLYESEIVAALARAIQAHLEKSTSSRTFQAQVLYSSEKDTNALSSGCAASSLAAPEAKGTPPARREASFPGATKALRPLSPSRESLSGFSFLGGKVTCADKVAVTPSPAKRQDNKYVRTDGQLQTLDAFYTPIKSPDLSRLSARLTPTPEKPVSLLEREALLLGIGKAAVDEPSVVEKPLASFGPVKPHRKRVEVRLTSVLDLIREFKEDSGDDARGLFAKSSFVGCLDTKRAAIQYETKLYMVNYAAISQTLFYQMSLLDFCNFSTIKVNPPAPIYQLIRFALGSNISVPPLSEAFGSQPDPALSLTNFLVSRREMLEEYYFITIDADGHLTTLPALIPKYNPPAHKLPQFFARLGSQVDWLDEKACFRTLGQELAILYQADFHPSKPAQTDEPDAVTKEFYHTVKHSLYPAMKRHLFPPRTWLNSQSGPSALDNHVRLLADLPDLYKVFERC